MVDASARLRLKPSSALIGVKPADIIKLRYVYSPQATSSMSPRQ